MSGRQAARGSSYTQGGIYTRGVSVNHETMAKAPRLEAMIDINAQCGPVVSLTALDNQFDKEKIRRELYRCERIGGPKMRPVRREERRWAGG